MISKYFLRGLFTFLPFGLTVYLFLSFILWSESVATDALSLVMTSHHFPGLGLVLAVSGICLLGFIVSQPIFNRLFSFVELPFTNVPIVKSVYSTFKNFSDYFSPGSKQGSQQVVLVQIPGQEFQVVGFLTRSHLKDLPNGFLKDDRVSVFLPMSYQIGGFTAFIPRAWTTPIDISVEVAMRSALTAWMPQKNHRDV